MNNLSYIQILQNKRGHIENGQIGFTKKDHMPSHPPQKVDIFGLVYKRNAN